MSRNTKLALIGVVALAALLRFAALDRIPPGIYPDEAMNGVNGLAAWESRDLKIFYPDNNGREGLFINIVGLSLKLFGVNQFGLRFPSALFGVLTVLGIFFLTRELFGKESPEARNPNIEVRNNVQNPNVQNSKRLEKLDLMHSDLFRISDFGFRIFRGDRIALLAAFFLATSFWHLNFSRISFRAIMVPLVLTWSFFFLLRAFRRNSLADFLVGGVIFGIGFHTYTAFRVAPLLLLLFFFLKHREAFSGKKTFAGVIFSLMTAFAVALPMSIYLLRHPNDFLKREGAKISVFEQQNPLKALGVSIGKTALMFNVRGDCNWRHNLPCRPQLGFIASPFFLLGLWVAFKKIFREKLLVTRYSLLVTWLLVMLLPEVLTAEGIPHALRAIGTIPPAYILAAIGFCAAYEKLIGKFHEKKHILRVAAAAIIAAAAVATAIEYFAVWARRDTTASEFTLAYSKIARYIGALDPAVPKFIIVNRGDVAVGDVTTHAQVVKLLLSPHPDVARSVTYLTLQRFADNLLLMPKGSVVIPLERDRSVFESLRSRSMDVTEIQFQYFSAGIIE